MENSPGATEIALIDMDGTIADFDAGLREGLVPLTSPWEIGLVDYERLPHGEDAPPWLEARMNLVKRQPGFWRNLRRIEDGFRVLEMIVAAGFETSILTKAPRTNHPSRSEKAEWCEEHVPDLPVTVCHDKGLVYGRILFDDFPAYALAWLKHRPNGTVLMLDGPSNQGFSHPQVVRVMRPFDVGVESKVRGALDRAKLR
jgi:5'(3')-deoxyribonucleotidase